MATTRRMPSPVIAILQIFRDRVGVGGAWTVEEIWKELRYGDRWGVYHYALGYGSEFQYGDLDTDLPQQWLTAVLQSLADLGLVVLQESFEGSSGFPRWGIGDSWRPPQPPSGGAGGGGRNFDTPLDDGGGDDDGGGGLREALSHPVLFALPLDDFGELVNKLFDEVEP